MGSLFRRWWTAPAAILFIYMVAGLLAPSEMTSRYPRSGVSDTVESILFVASRIERYAIPASVLGIIIGFGMALGLSRMPRHARYTAYVAVASLSAPIVVLSFSTEAHEGYHHVFPLVEFFRHLKYGYGVLILAIVAALCAFCIANLRYSGVFSEPTSASSQDAANAASSLGLLFSRRSWSWVGLCFFASLSLTIVAIWQIPELYGFKTGDVSPLSADCRPDGPYLSFDEWGCRPADYSYLMQWLSWLPQMSTLLVLAASILMATGFASQLRRIADRAAPSTTTQGAYWRTGVRWSTLPLGILLTTAAAVFIGVVSPAVLAGACGGVALGALVSSRHRFSRYIFNGLVSAAITACSMMLVVTLNNVFIRCSPGSLDRSGCRDLSKAIDFDLFPSSDAWLLFWMLILLLAFLVLFVSLTVLPMMKSKASNRVLKIMIVAVGGWALLALIITSAHSVWWPGVGSVVISAEFLNIAPQPVPQVHTLSGTVGLLVLVLFVSKYRDVRSACNLLVWCGVGLPMLVALGMSNPEVEALLFRSGLEGFYGEGGRLIRDLLLALVVAYTYLWFANANVAPVQDGQSDGTGHYRSGPQDSMVALLVALSSACFVYVVVSVILYDENVSRISLALGYVWWVDWHEQWGLLPQFCVYALELCLITAAGIWAYSHVRHIQRSGTKALTEA